jgi:hypothetical protein
MTEMQGVEQPVTPHSVNPFSLEVPERLLYPAFASLRDLTRRPWPTPARYVPGPQPEGTARVTLSDDYYLGPVWGEYRPQSLAGPEDVFDIPVEQRDRWQAAQDAYADMQGEIEVLMRARREPIKRGTYIPQP